MIKTLFLGFVLDEAFLLELEQRLPMWKKKYRIIKNRSIIVDYVDDLEKKLIEIYEK